MRRRGGGHNFDPRSRRRTSLQAVAAGVAYHQLRVTEEGLDEEELAAVFD